MIRYERFTKHYGRIVAVDALDLAVEPGETLALVGPNGSGKTTTLKAAVGLVRPSSGVVSVAGMDATSGGAVARATLGYLPQRLSFAEGVTASETMDFYARLRRAGGAPDELLERVGLSDDADRPVEEFSGGMRQRLGIAIALLGAPRALILDEPSAALDPTGALMIRDIIARIRADGTTVLLSSHDLAEVAALADRIAVFSAGRIRAMGTLQQLEAQLGCSGIESVYTALAA